MRLRIVSCGEVLWDMFPTGPVLGGAPLNFAYRVVNIGHEGLVASAAGTDEAGSRLLSAMEELHLNTSLVQRNAHPTGRVDIEFDAAKNPSYTIRSKVAYEFLRYDAALGEAVASSDCFCFSTLAQREPAFRETLRELLSRAAGRPVLYDVNLRVGCYEDATIRASLEEATLLKMNEEEAAELGRICLGRGATALEVAEALTARHRLRACVVTLGPRGSCAVDASGRRVYSPGFAVDLVDPCGAGDSFAAGFVVSLLSGRSLAEACEFGNALGALTSAQNGATTPLTLADVEALRRRKGGRVTDLVYQKFN